MKVSFRPRWFLMFWRVPFYLKINEKCFWLGPVGFCWWHQKG